MSTVSRLTSDLPGLLEISERSGTPVALIDLMFPDGLRTGTVCAMTSGMRVTFCEEASRERLRSDAAGVASDDCPSLMPLHVDPLDGDRTRLASRALGKTAIGWITGVLDSERDRVSFTAAANFRSIPSSSVLVGRGVFNLNPGVASMLEFVEAFSLDPGAASMLKFLEAVAAN